MVIRGGRGAATFLGSDALLVNRRKRKLLLTTKTELNAIAAPAMSGLSRPRAARGSAAML